MYLIVIIVSFFLILAGAGVTHLHRRAPGPAPAPTSADVQSAYDAEGDDKNTRHIRGLRVVGVDCDHISNNKFSCQVGFTNPETPEERVFLDVATLESVEPKNWKLRSGLCRSQNY